MSTRGRLRAALGGGLAAVAIFYGWSPAPDPLRPGDWAPDFSLPRAGAAESISLTAQRGRVVLLNFWATWCKPCLDEMPAMQRLYKALDGEDFELLAVSVDRDAGAAQTFGERLGLTFPILLDPERAVATDFQTFVWPESYVIDRRGRIAAHYVGPRPWDSALYLDSLRELLSGAPETTTPGPSGSVVPGGADRGVARSADSG